MELHGEGGGGNWVLHHFPDFPAPASALEGAFRAVQNSDFWFVFEAFLVLKTRLKCDFRTGSTLLQRLAFGPMRGYLEVAIVYKKRYFEFGS